MKQLKGPYRQRQTQEQDKKGGEVGNVGIWGEERATKKYERRRLSREDDGNMGGGKFGIYRRRRETGKLSEGKTRT